MKKDSILVRVIAVLLAINFCFGLVWVAVFGAIKPMAISLVKNVVADEIIESASDRVDANMENNETEKKILDKVMANSDEIEELIDIYVDGLNKAIDGNGDVEFKDTTAIYETLNDEIIDLAEMQRGVKLTDNQRAIIEKKLKSEEAKIEENMGNMVKNQSTQNNNSSQTILAIQVYDNFTSGRYLINMSIILVVIAGIIIAMRWKSKGWLLNLGIASIFSALFITVIPTMISLFIELVMEKNYVIANDAYFYTFAAITGVVGILMIVLKNTLFKTVKKDEGIIE